MEPNLRARRCLVPVLAGWADLDEWETAADIQPRQPGAEVFEAKYAAGRALGSARVLAVVGRSGRTGAAHPALTGISQIAPALAGASRLGSG